MRLRRVSRRFDIASALVMLLAGAVACSTRDGDVGATVAAETAGAAPAALLVSDPSTLMELERRGLSFSAMMGVRGTSGKALLDSNKYRAIVDTIASDLREFHERDPESGIGLDVLHRQFDPKWLGSEQSRFELVGVVNRFDKRDASNCGELRFIYRFAYTATRTEGRLPMTVSLLATQPDDHQQCASVANRWLSVGVGSADALLAGPLADRQPFHQVEINLQSVRWVAGPDEQFFAIRGLGAHAEYVLRAFSVQGDTLVEAPLLNTPRTNLDQAERTELGAWIGDNLDAIDHGTAAVPAKFLATRAISVSPYGLSRLANRAFSQLFPNAADAFSGLPLDGTKQIGTVTALMRRLDTMTCNGCHQARGVAGFHLLGEERDPAARINALAVGRSPHLNDDLGWRAAALTALATGRPYASPRPFAEHGASEGAFGTHCGLGDSGFRSWSCPSGLECLDHHEDAVGVCMPVDAVHSETPFAPLGAVCEVGRITPDADPHQDELDYSVVKSCQRDRHFGVGPTDCYAPVFSQGFPDGMCVDRCKNSDLGKIEEESICGGIPDKDRLNTCLTVEHRPFKECLESTMEPTVLRKCSAQEQCRDDYVCMRVLDGPEETGGCTPPYFAFQVRVDGHMFDD